MTMIMRAVARAAESALEAMYTLTSGMYHARPPLGIEDPELASRVRHPAGKGLVPEQEVLNLSDAAAECGLTVDELVKFMVLDGLLLEHPNGGHIPAPHNDIQEL